MKRIAILILAVIMPFLLGCVLKKGGTADITASETVQYALTDGTYKVSPDASTLYWEAYKLVGGHMGGIDIKSGELIVHKGQPRSGSFVIDMTSMTNTDIKSESLKTSLINHLKSDDFFAVADYPTARFDITRVIPDADSGPNAYLIEGDLSIRDVTKGVIVHATINEHENRLSAHGKADVDRTGFGITTRSGSFFENLGDQMIKDIFTLEMELSADRVQERF